ncbi:MAG: poly(R)-hydroxyalkanoic acid synthase subunit PhaE [Syntrophales bacterium]|jgi:hypothetical protein
MSEIPERKNASAADFTDLMKLQSDLLNSFLKVTPSSNEPPKDAERGRSMKAWDSAIKIIQTASSAMTEPASINAMTKGVSALPDVMMRLAQSAWQASLQMQNRVIEHAAKIGQKKEAFKFDQIGQETFQAWTEIYREEFQRYFHIPQLGLSRFYQERFNHLIDQYNLLQSGMVEFFNVLYLPVERSFKVMEEKLETMAKEGNIPKSANEYYQMWIKTLEGHYMVLFKSPEYNQSFSDTIGRIVDFLNARNQVISDLLQGMPIPTNKEMDAVYKDLYHLKNRIAKLEVKKRKKQ